MDVIMPQLGETVTEGKISSWFKKPGDRVDAGDNLFEIETDKVTMEVQSTASGVLSEIRVKDGETVPVGSVVAVIGETGAVAQAAAPGDAPDMVGSTAAATPEDRFRPEPGSPFLPSRGNGATAGFRIAPFAETSTPTGNFGKAKGPLGLKITPLARRLIVQNGVDLAELAQGVKAKGASRIGRAEVEAALANRASPAARVGMREALASSGAEEHARSPAATEGERVPFNSIRRQTAERLAMSWRTIPHVFQGVDVDFAAVESVRRTRKAEFKNRNGVSLTYVPFIVRAVAIVLREYPRVNARLDGDGLVLASQLNLGLAVDLAHQGLVVPVLKNADELTVGGLAKAIAGMVERAKQNALRPDDFAGGTYTISNNGSFGTLFTAPIINPPQVAILSVDAVKKRAVVVETETGDAVAVHPVGILTQSFDHRAFDGAYSAAFLRRLKQVLETHDWNVELS